MGKLSNSLHWLLLKNMSNKKNNSYKEQIGLARKMLLSLEKGDAENQLELLKQIMDLSQVLTDENPKSSESWMMLGLAQYWSNNPTAKQSFKTAFDLSKKTESNTRATCLYHIGKLSLSEGDLKDAENMFDKVLKIKPNHVHTLHDMSIIYAKTDRSKDAIKFLKMVVKEDSDFPGAAENLSVLLFHEK